MTATAATTPTRTMLPALTGVRAIAAYMVFFHHYSYFLYTDNILGNMVYLFVAELHTGVTVFFVLSGFLIQLTYASRVELKSRFLATYLGNRIARVLPLYALIVLITAVYAWRTDTYAVDAAFQFFMQVSFLRGFFQQFIGMGVGQGWSLTVEMTFYVLFPLLVIATTRFGRLVTLAACLATGLALFGLGTLVDAYGFFSPLSFVALYTFFGRATEFVLGMALADLFKAAPAERHELRLVSALHGRWTLIGAAGTVLSIGLLSIIHVAFPQFPYGVLHPLGIAVNNLLLPVCIAAFFWGVITEPGWISTLLGGRLFGVFGRASYAFYLIHVGVIASAVKLTTGLVWLDLLWLFVITNVIAIGLFYLVEEPARSLTKRWVTAIATRQPPAPRTT